MFDLFKEAIEAGEHYIHASITKRDTRYRFLGTAFLSHREGQQDRDEFDKLLYSRLDREPTKPEKKEPFLRLVHALLKEGTLAPEDRSQCTKLANALRRIDEEFKDTATVTIEGVIDFLKENGGVSGLYKAKASHTSPTIEKAQDGPDAQPGMDSGTVSRVAAGTNQGPGEDASQCQEPQDAPITIEIAKLGALVIKHGKDTTLRMPAFPPGKHSVCIKVGQDGLVEEIISEESYQKAA